VEVAKAKSFRGASDVLQMPSSTVSRRIAELEAEVGLRLFNRNTRRVDLTDAGSVYFVKCKNIIDEAQLAFDELAEMKNNPSGLLRLSMPVAFISEWLAPLLPEFARLYPEIQLDINVSKVPIPLFSDSADVAIVFGYPTGQDVVPRKIVGGRTGLYASPGDCSGQLKLATTPPTTVPYQTVQIRLASAVFPSTPLRQAHLGTDSGHCLKNCKRSAVS
jgi:DNA-binding transcriptional LysR family regulator